MAWITLYGAILFEVAGTVTLKYAQGFERPLLLALAVCLYAVSILLFAIAIKQVPLYVASAIWAGIGITAVSLIGVFYFNEPVTAAKIGFVALILIGAVGLNLSTRTGATGDIAKIGASDTTDHTP